MSAQRRLHASPSLATSEPPVTSRLMSTPSRSPLPQPLPFVVEESPVGGERAQRSPKTSTPAAAERRQFDSRLSATSNQAPQETSASRQKRSSPFLETESSPAKRAATSPVVDEQKKSPTKVDEWSCPICLDTRTECEANGGGILALLCAHTFCRSCVEDWLTAHNSCPVCKTRQRPHHVGGSHHRQHHYPAPVLRAPPGTRAPRQIREVVNMLGVQAVPLGPASLGHAAAAPPRRQQQENHLGRYFAPDRSLLHQSFSSSEDISVHQPPRGIGRGGGDAARDIRNSALAAVFQRDLETLRQRVNSIREQSLQIQRQRHEQREMGSQHPSNQDDEEFTQQMRLAIQRSLEEAERLRAIVTHRAEAQQEEQSRQQQSAASSSSVRRPTAVAGNSGRSESAASSAAIAINDGDPSEGGEIADRSSRGETVTVGSCRGSVVGLQGQKVQCEVRGCKSVVLRNNYERHCAKMHCVEECVRCKQQVQHHLMKRHLVRGCVPERLL